MFVCDEVWLLGGRARPREGRLPICASAWGGQRSTTNRHDFGGSLMFTVPSLNTLTRALNSQPRFAARPVLHLVGAPETPAPLCASLYERARCLDVALHAFVTTHEVFRALDLGLQACRSCSVLGNSAVACRLSAALVSWLLATSTHIDEATHDTPCLKLQMPHRVMDAGPELLQTFERGGTVQRTHDIFVG